MAGEGCSIVGFIHVYMINNYYAIFTEQVDLIYKSGLYDRCQFIFVGCLGSKKDKLRLEHSVKEYSKYKFSAIGNRDMFEFYTLRYLKETVNNNPDFYGFYIHSKGVSWPNNVGGKHWRDYMNYYTLVRWKDNVTNLERGNDTCGVKLLGKQWPLHYSGNFFWFNSAYVKKLQEIDSLNMKNRNNAEFWICSGRRVRAATLCQKFVDYNTKGKFKP